DACPDAVPPRVKDPAYREKYVAWLAEGATVRAFDGEARAREARVNEATQRLQFLKLSDTQVRVDPAAFDAPADALFAPAEYLAQLHAEHGVYALNPDGAEPELQQRLGLSMFAQGWLPFLDEERAQRLLARARLRAEYLEAEPPPAHAAQCSGCGGELA